MKLLCNMQITMHVSSSSISNDTVPILDEKPNEDCFRASSLL